MQIVIPMAGLGQRFAEAGYTLPKPLIPINGTPMVVRALRDLPAAERIILVCHPEHVARFHIDRVLQKQVPGCRIVVAPGLTQGQACSVRLASGELSPNEPVLVTACDNTHLYDPRAFAGATAEPAVESLIWTYRHDTRVLIRPQAHGWVDAADDGRVRGISVKVPLSDHPLDDHAVSGCFWFRSAKGMLDATDALVDSGRTTNGEYYLDSVPARLLAKGQMVRVFEVQKYIGWGTPQDLDDFLRWEQYFIRRAA